MVNPMDQVTWSFTTEVDTTAPTVDTLYPADEAVDVSIDTTISCHVKDAETGVDESSIVMTVNGVEVDVVVTGDPDDLTVTYTPAVSLEYETEYTVTIDASDLA